MSVQENLNQLRKEIPSHVTLVAVSKTMPVEVIREAYNAGQRDFGENRVQELLAKQPLLPADIRWHMIGHLQTNKVKYIVPFVSMIQSVDSLKLMRIVNREAEKNGKVQDILFEIHIASEESKFGFGFEELLDILHQDEWKSFHNLRIRGVMGMATFTSDREQVRDEFRKLNQMYKTLKTGFFPHDEQFYEISMGMSGDYAVAIEEGSTMVRIGTKIFGHR